MPKKVRPSKRYKQQVRDIIGRIDDRLPFEYVDAVQEILKGKGLEVSDSRVVNVRNGRSYDLNIAAALEQLALQREVVGESVLAADLGLVKK